MIFIALLIERLFSLIMSARSATYGDTLVVTTWKCSACILKKFVISPYYNKVIVHASHRWRGKVV